MSRCLVVLSGNIAVGKSTLGVRLAQSLQAKWLPETNLSMQFPQLIADECGYSKLVAEIAFPALRLATILSTFLTGIETIVTERSLWDDWMFFELWAEQFGLTQHLPFMKELFDVLGNHPFEYELYTIYLQSTTHSLPGRALRRNKPYDHLFTQDVVDKIDVLYKRALSERPKHVIGSVDVSDLDILDPVQIEFTLHQIRQLILTQRATQPLSK